MLSKDCKECRYCVWLVALGFGIRCKKEENQKYIPEDDSHKHLPVIIVYVPDGCKYRTVHAEEIKKNEDEK